jgi:hypothetical protein
MEGGNSCRTNLASVYQAMTSVDIYNTLEDPGAFRILELNQTHLAETQLSGRLISSRLEDALDYCAVSYV